MELDSENWVIGLATKKPRVYYLMRSDNVTSILSRKKSEKRKR
jgi:hypothetical protein